MNEQKMTLRQIRQLIVHYSQIAAIFEAANAREVAVKYHQEASRLIQILPKHLRRWRNRVA